ncbi:MULTISPECIES: hypothetical protein [unclassified Streptomyces]|uniref:hypothetical protein n=1 Tax=unclassified Streptomyces TaxID=2593676 RepID=UPI001CC18B13|nr:hypothetical protein [Streptomyces sp. 135]
MNRRPFLPRIPRLSPRAAAVAAAVGALLCLPLSAAPASAGERATCSLQEGLDLRDTIGNAFTKALYCDNLPSDVYGRPSFDAPITGWLRLTPSWFTCYTIGPRDTQGNNVWYYTQGDQVGELPRIKGWGNVPAEVVKIPSTMSHPVAGLPRCPWY